jgi:hypothetical protein
MLCRKTLYKQSYKHSGCHSEFISENLNAESTCMCKKSSSIKYKNNTNNNNNNNNRYFGQSVDEVRKLVINGRSDIKHILLNVLNLLPKFRSGNNKGK